MPKYTIDEIKDIVIKLENSLPQYSEHPTKEVHAAIRARLRILRDKVIALNSVLYKDYKAFCKPTPPIAGKKLYLDEQSQLHAFLKANSNLPEYQLLKERIADVPKGIWISSEWSTDYEGIVARAKAQKCISIFIVYNALKRDVGGQS